jgi:ubiquinone/menaquinone biosynthesis C-methylase UbiE/uncharacterized protein YbaR (Trm112 family)
MKKEHLKYLACPKCYGDLKISQIKEEENGLIKTGQLLCGLCHSTYDIASFIPRFVSLENYASSFGLEWTKNARTQYDSYTNSGVSEQRFFGETGWPRDMKEQTILEVGSGSGRFTEQAASTGAMVVSMDYSCAVEANYQSNGKKGNVLIVQADIYLMPFKKNYFEKVLCIGVLQHTPDVKKAFFALPQFLKTEGSLVIDVYRKPNRFVTKYMVRHLTKRMNHELLYKLCKNYICFMWPIARFINRLPQGRKINGMLLIADYRGEYKLSEKILKEWAILDTFDMLSPAHDHPQRLESVEDWFKQAGLKDVEIDYKRSSLRGRK